MQIRSNAIYEKSSRLRIVIFVLVWTAFALPVPYWTSFPFVLGHTNLSEIAMILIPIVYYFLPRKASTWHTKALVFTIAAFFGSVALSAFVQIISYGSTVADIFRVLRHNLPLFVGVSILLQGAKLDSKSILIHILASIGFSYLILFGAIATGWTPQPQVGATLNVESFEVFRSGRIYNVNAGFGYLGVALLASLFATNKSIVPASARIASIICTILILIGATLSFNRTLWAVSAVLVLYLALVYTNPRSFIGVVAILACVVCAGYLSYNFVDEVKMQVDARVVSPLRDGAILDSVYYDNRDLLYANYLELAKEFWLFGVPGYLNWSEAPTAYGPIAISVADISFVTVLLKYGIFALFAWFSIFFLIFKEIFRASKQDRTGWTSVILKTIAISFPFIVAASLNADVLSREYLVLFVTLLISSVGSSDQERIARTKLRRIAT